MQNEYSTIEVDELVGKKGTYSKPAAGIPEDDLAQAVSASLGRADTAIQPVFWTGTAWPARPNVPCVAFIGGTATTPPPPGPDGDLWLF